MREPSQERNRLRFRRTVASKLGTSTLDSKKQQLLIAVWASFRWNWAVVGKSNQPNIKMTTTGKNVVFLLLRCRASTYIKNTSPHASIGPRGGCHDGGTLSCRFLVTFVHVPVLQIHSFFGSFTVPCGLRLRLSVCWRSHKASLLDPHRFGIVGRFKGTHDTCIHTKSLGISNVVFGS